MKRFAFLLAIFLLVSVLTAISISASEYDTQAIFDYNYSSINNNHLTLKSTYPYAFSGHIPYYQYEIIPNYSVLSIDAPIRTTDNSPVEAYDLSFLEVDEESADAEVEEYREYLDFTVAEDEYTYAYNCHYYAWCDDWCADYYWVPDAQPFIDDVHTYTLKDYETPQVGDKVTYWRNGVCVHSAIVFRIEDDTVICESKWGALGVYIHAWNQVPIDYAELDGTINVQYHRYTHGEHSLSIYEDNGESGHTFVCTAKTEDENGNVLKTCSYTTECDGEFTVTSVNSSYHRIYCPDCYYSEYASHDLYMYSAAPEDYVVKCRDCTYTVECWESPEYYGDSDDGHWVDCACGCYSFFEPHTFSYSSTEQGRHDIECADCGYLYSEDCSYVCSDIGTLYYHTLECSVCRDTDTELHNWIRVGTKYRCLICGRQETIIPTDVMSLSEEELELLLSSMSEEELGEFIAALPEDAVARVTAILPPVNDDELLTE